MTKFSLLAIRALLAGFSASIPNGVLPGSMAMSPNGAQYEIELPDGSKILAQMSGSELDPYEEDEAGYPIIGAGEAGNDYEYAILDSTTGDLVPSGTKAGRGNKPPAGAVKHQKRTGKGRENMGLGGDGPSGRGKSGSRGVSPNRDVKLPTRRLSHVDEYEHWNEQIEDFHRRTMDWTGTKRNLVIPMIFSGHETRWRPSKVELDVLFNNVGPNSTYAPTGSVRDMFNHTSYGKLDMVSDVVEWVQLSNTEKYYANGARGFTTVMHQAMREALIKLDNAGFNFKQYDADNDGLIDAICFLHTGYAAEWGGNAEDGANYLDRIWSHKWSLYSFKYPSTAANFGFTSKQGVRVYNYHISPAIYGTYPSTKTLPNKMGRVGVIAHETGHFLGITDLYDTGAGDNGNGIGSWGLMANSWGFNNDQRCIPIMDPWSKIQLGWLTPKMITASGTYSLKDVYTNQDVYKISAGYPTDEYLLLEYRKKIGFESCMPTEGLLAWKIDDKAGYDVQGWPGQAGWPANGKHYRISVLQADGKYDLEKYVNRGDSGDLFYKGFKTYLGPATKAGGAPVYPNTDSYQGGNIVETGIEIMNVGTPGATLTFDVVIPVPPPPPTKSPTRKPTMSPTKRITKSPTKAPIKVTKTPTRAPIVAPVAPVPAPVAPVPAPVSAPVSSPASAPVATLTCDSASFQTKFSLDLNTDDFASELSWQVIDILAGNVVVQSGGPYTDGAKYIKREACLDNRSCYKFIMRDSGRDGIQGAGRGYKVSWNDKIEDQTIGNPAFSVKGIDFGTRCSPTTGGGLLDLGKAGDTAFYGNMFDVIGTSDIIFRRFSNLQTSSTSTYQYKVYTKNGSYKGFENDPASWTLMQDQVITGAGPASYTTTTTTSYSVPIMSETTQAFYVVLDKPELMYINGANKGMSEGAVFKSFPGILNVTVGIYNNVNFGSYGGPAAFGGKIAYVPLSPGVSGATVEVAGVNEVPTESENLEEIPALPLPANLQAQINSASDKAYKGKNSIDKPDNSKMQTNSGLGRDMNQDGFKGQ